MTTSSVKCSANFFCHSVRLSMTSGVGSGVFSGAVSSGAEVSAGAGEPITLEGVGIWTFFAVSRGMTW